MPCPNLGLQVHVDEFEVRNLFWTGGLIKRISQRVAPPPLSTRVRAERYALLGARAYRVLAILRRCDRYTSSGPEFLRAQVRDSRRCVRCWLFFGGVFFGGKCRILYS